MKTEIGGTFKWSTDQIGAYAAAFREGDAVKVGGEWYEVKRHEDVGIRLDVVHSISSNSVLTAEDNSYNLNYDHDGEGNFTGIANGFSGSCVESPYEIVSPKDYRVKEGDKLVWLGETDGNHSFGTTYNVFRSETERLVYLDNKSVKWAVSLTKRHSDVWGTIPRHENVKEEKGMNGNDECVGKFKKGDRVKVTGGGYKGSEGVVTQSDELNGKLSCAVLLDDGCGGRWFAEEYLELVKEEEISVKQAEQEAFEYLLALDKTLVRIFLTDEINDWAKEYMRQKDYNSAKRAIEILEKLEKGE